MKKNKSIIKIVIVVVLFILLLIRSLIIREENQSHYDNGKELLEAGKYTDALAEFELSNDFKDASELQEEAIKKEACKNIHDTYRQANKNKDEGDLEASIKGYNLIIESLKQWNTATEIFEDVFYEDISQIEFDAAETKNAVNAILNICIKQEIDARYLLAVQKYNEGDINSAQTLFSESDIIDYKDSREYLAKINIQNIEQSKETVYVKAVDLFNNKDYLMAKENFEMIKDYRDSQIMIQECDNCLERECKENTIFVGINCCGAVSSVGGKVICAGKNYFGQLDIDNQDGIISIDGYNTLTIGIDQNKNAVVAGKYDLTYEWKDGKTVDTNGWNDVVDVAAGEQFVVALRDDGTVLFGGHDGNGLKDSIEQWTDIIAVEAGYTFAVGLCKNGGLVFAGNANRLQTEYLSNAADWENVVNIAASGGNTNSNHITYGHVIGLKEDGTLVSIGDNNYGQCDVSEWPKMLKVVAGDWYTVGITNDRTLMITGKNEPGQAYIDYDKLNAAKGVIDVAAGFGGTIYKDQSGKYEAFGFEQNGWPELLKKLNH